jgi:hypothetical protein
MPNTMETVPEYDNVYHLLVTSLIALDRLATYCIVLSHTCLAYIVVIPSRVFLRVFSLDFPLLG